MANPRQRRKSRSSSHRPVKHSRQANKLLKKQPPILGPKVLQDAWDKHKTVRQNYAALGLAHSLTPTDSGGKDITHRVLPPPSNQNQKPATTPRPSAGDEARETTLPRGYARIVRDEEGNVVDVVLPEDDDESESAMEVNPVPVPDLDLDPGVDAGWLLSPDAHGIRTDLESGSGLQESVVRALEERAKGGEAGQAGRTSSSAEVRYLQRLVMTHGEDYEKMARDRKGNVQQYTAGQLRRAIAKAGLA